MQREKERQGFPEREAEAFQGRSVAGQEPGTEQGEEQGQGASL